MDKFREFISFFILFICDLLLVIGAFSLTFFERTFLNQFVEEQFYVYELDKYLHFYMIYIVFFVIMFLYGIYSKRLDFWAETKRIIKSVIFTFLMIMSSVMLMKTAHEYSRIFLTLFFMNLLILIPPFKLIMKRVLYQSGVWKKRAYVIGGNGQSDYIKQKILTDWYMGYVQTNKVSSAKTVFIATKNMTVDTLEKLIYKYKKKVDNIYLIPFLYHISFANADILDLNTARLSLVGIKDHLSIKKNIVIKRVFEMILVLILLPIGLLVITLIAILIKLDSRGSAFFMHKRIGREGKSFRCIKFRTMHQESHVLLKEYLKEHPQEKLYYEKYHKYQNDPRVTRIGKIIRKLSLDELPQILNILKGDMDLIGPRPYMIKEKFKLGKCGETIFQVRPGITGLWQVSGRNDLEFEQRVELDCWYIQNWSLWLDFIIFLKTFEVLITRKGAK